MKYEEYITKYENTDHVLIRMTDSFPYFKEKMVVKNGVSLVYRHFEEDLGNRNGISQDEINRLLGDG